MEELTATGIIRQFKAAKSKRGAWESHWRFSCWNEDDPNRGQIISLQPGDKLFDCCRRIARRAVNGVLEDKTRSATHYHAQGVFPSWARGKAPSVEIGHHLFYNDIE